MALLIPGGPVLCGDRGIHLLLSSGERLLVCSLLGGGPVAVPAAGGPGRPGGRRPAPHLCHQRQPADGAGQQRPLRRPCHLQGGDRELTVELDGRSELQAFR